MKFGKHIDEVNDLDSFEPSSTWLEVYERLYVELQEMGIPLS